MGRREGGAGAAWVRLEPAFRRRARNQRLVCSARQLLLLVCWSGLVRPTWLHTGEQDGGGPGSVRPWVGGTGRGTARTLQALRGGVADHRSSFFEDEDGGVPGNAFAATRSGGAMQIDSLGVSHKPLGAAASVANVEGVVVGGGPVAGAKVAATARVEAGGGPGAGGSWLAAGEEGGGSEELLGGGRRRVRGRSRRGGSAAHGEGTDADTYYKAVMALNPSDVGIMCEYAETLARAGALRFGDAEDVLMRALRLRPESAMVLGRYGSFLEQHKGDVPEAEQLYQRAIDADPDRSLWVHLLCICLRALHAACARALHAACAALTCCTCWPSTPTPTPDSAAPVLSNLAALVLTHYCDTARAEQLLLRALATSPTDAHSLNSYGLYLHSSGGDKNIDDAEHLFRIAIAIDDSHLDAMNNLAVLLETVRADLPAAEQLYRRALAVDNQHPATLSNYAHHLHALKQDFGAAETVRTSMPRCGLRWISLALHVCRLPSMQCRA